MTPTCNSILNDFSASFWLKDALRSALHRDIVDALAEAETLAAALLEHRNFIIEQHTGFNREMG